MTPGDVHRMRAAFDRVRDIQKANDEIRNALRLLKDAARKRAESLPSYDDTPEEAAEIHETVVASMPLQMAALAAQHDHDDINDPEATEAPPGRDTTPTHLDALWDPDRWPTAPSAGGYVARLRCRRLRIFKRCGCQPTYQRREDCYWCQRHHRWMESRCPDPTCEYCTARTDRPVAIANAEKLWADIAKAGAAAAKAAEVADAYLRGGFGTVEELRENERRRGES